VQDHLDVDNPSPAPPQSGVKHYAMAMQFCLSVCRFVCRLKLMTAGGGGSSRWPIRQTWCSRDLKVLVLVLNTKVLVLVLVLKLGLGHGLGIVF